MIRFEKASVTYGGGVHAMTGLTLDIADGEFVVIVGLSGAGKSTLIRAVNGLVPLTSGTLEVNGVTVPGLSRRELRQLRADIGMIFQGFNLVNRTTVLNNVLMGRLHRVPTWRTLVGLYPAADREIAMRALERVEIVEKAYVRASNLSGGQRQRVGIARALAQEPKIILADEPVASLDPPTSHVVMRYLQQINRELGMTTIVNLHFLDLATAYADRIVGLRDGELVFDGTGAEADATVFERIYGRSLTADDTMAKEACPPSDGHGVTDRSVFAHRPCRRRRSRRPQRPPRKPVRRFGSGRRAAIVLHGAHDRGGRRHRVLVPRPCSTSSATRTRCSAALPHAELAADLLAPSRARRSCETLQLAVLGTIAGSIVSLPFALWSHPGRRPNRGRSVVVRTCPTSTGRSPTSGWAAAVRGRRRHRRPAGCSPCSSSRSPWSPS